MNLTPHIVLVAIGCIIMGAVSYDTSNPNAVIEEETKRLNANIEKLISVIESQNTKTNDDYDVIIKTINRIYLSLQPLAFDMDGNLSLDD